LAGVAVVTAAGSYWAKSAPAGQPDGAARNDYANQGNISRFALNGFRDMCSFGMPTSPRDWILVRMKDGRRARYGGHVPVRVYGRLEVGFDGGSKSVSPRGRRRSPVDPIAACGRGRGAPLAIQITSPPTTSASHSKSTKTIVDQLPRRRMRRRRWRDPR
jgi:hypothetical protein